MIATIQSKVPAGSAASTRMLISAEDYRYIEDGFRSGLPVNSGIEWHLRSVMTDTLSHPGSLARAQLAFSLLRQFRLKESEARDVGIAIEYFHTASLLFDDLPCMDNAEKRRGHSCPHVVHGESSAILGALALINQGYALLWRAMNRLPESNRSATQNLVNDCLGLNGILNGQAHDLHFADSARNKSDVLRIAHGKTVTLIRLTLLLPAHMGGADEQILSYLEKLSVSWGLAYQIMDDFKDGLMNSSETGKTTARDRLLAHPNLPLSMGNKEALNVLNQKLNESRESIFHLIRLRCAPSALPKLQDLLEEERNRITRLMGSSNNCFTEAVT